MDATTVAIDLAKSTFEVAVATATGRVIARHRFTKAQLGRWLRNVPPAEVVMEACGTAHHWARLLRELGHEVTLLPPQYVRPYVRRQKTDRTDAEALLEARRSGGILPVPIKTPMQQALVALHRVRVQWQTTRTARLNAVRGLLREHGIELTAGARGGMRALPTLLEDAEAPIPWPLRRILGRLYDEIRAVEGHLATLERELEALAETDPVIPRLLTIPGIGLITATALVASVPHIHGFARGRRFASWLGLTPRAHSSGTRRRLGRITKAGDAYLRCLLTHGARSVLVQAQRRRRTGGSLSPLGQWALTVAARAGHNKATIAVANKLARMVWAVWRHDVPYIADVSRRRAA